MTTLITPGHAVLQTPEAWALRINARWRQSIENYFETGDLLIDAKNSLPYGEFETMVQSKLMFNPSTARRLMIIAKDQRLRAHVHDLPPSWGTIYELSKLPDAVLDRAFAAKIIHCEMERSDVDQLRPNETRPRALAPPVIGTDTGEPAGYEHPSNAGMDGDGDTPLAAGSPVSVMPSGGLAIAHQRVEPGDSLDFFPTPPWATRALFEHVFTHLEKRGHCKFQEAWEPACGEGHMAEVMGEYFRRVYASDKADYGYGVGDYDFLTTAAPVAFDWIITNPPFNDSTEFVLKALKHAGAGVAMFVRLTWLESVGRYEKIFRDKPPTCLAIFTERVPLHKGRWEEDGATMTAYIWLVWIKGAEPRAPFWIPPGCRETLTKPDDAKRFGKKREQAA